MVNVTSYFSHEDKTTTLYNESHSNEIDKLIAPSTPPPPRAYKPLMTLPLERPRLLHNHLSSLMYVRDYKKRRGGPVVGPSGNKGANLYQSQ